MVFQDVHLCIYQIIFAEFGSFSSKDLAVFEWNKVSNLAKLQKSVTKIDFTKTGSLTSSSPLKTVEEQIIGEDIYKHEVCDANH